MKIGLLGTGFGVAHAGIYHRHPEVDEVIVFGRTQAKLEKIAAEFGFATTTELDAIYDDPSIDLVDVCLPTRPDLPQRPRSGSRSRAADRPPRSCSTTPARSCAAARRR
jgi:Oxidoreductase family, NAD-binding Rossmann fold